MTDKLAGRAKKKRSGSIKKRLISRKSTFVANLFAAKSDDSDDTSTSGDAVEKKKRKGSDVSEEISTRVLKPTKSKKRLITRRKTVDTVGSSVKLAEFEKQGRKRQVSGRVARRNVKRLKRKTYPMRAKYLHLHKSVERQREAVRKRLSVPHLQSRHFFGQQRLSKIQLHELIQKWLEELNEKQKVIQDPLSGALFNQITEKVVAGTPYELVDFMCMFPKDLNFMEELIMMHKTFMTSEALIERLIYLFKNADTHFRDIEKPNRVFILTRIVNALKKYLQLHHKDSQEVTDLVHDFTNYLRDTHSPYTRILVKLHRTKTHTLQMSKFPEPQYGKWKERKKYPSPGNMNPLEFSRQLCLAYIDYFHNIDIDDLVMISHGKNVDNMKPLEDISKKMTSFVSSSIILQNEIQKQAKYLEFFISTCDCLVNYNNFQAAIDIYNGVDYFLVGRLKKTWRRVDEDILKIWKMLQDLMSPLHSWKNIRTLFNNCTPPCTFPAAILQRDLITINENDPYYDKECTRINFEKRRLMATVIKSIQKTQSEFYLFHAVTEIQHKIESFELMEEEFLEIAYQTLSEQRPSGGTLKIKRH